MLIILCKQCNSLILVCACISVLYLDGAHWIICYLLRQLNHQYLLSGQKVLWILNQGVSD